MLPPPATTPSQYARYGVAPACSTSRSAFSTISRGKSSWVGTSLGVGMGEPRDHHVQPRLEFVTGQPDLDPGAATGDASPPSARPSTFSNASSR